ncbi:MAG TPA: alkaline phosphatase family protein [Candidatus Binataceae bacterium]|nr:alkaline phosphatase family protein [Candidatus Binataceae bacterium]
MKRIALVFAFGAALLTFARAPRAQEHQARGRIFVLMVWDGLRADFVTQRDTPNLYRLAREGVRFDRHHSIFPTLTMVNAAALATGAMPGTNGLEGNVVYWWPILSGLPSAASNPALAKMFGAPYFMESTTALEKLNAPDALAGRMLGVDAIGQEVEREGGYVAVLGKAGPTYLFDDRFNTVQNGKDSLSQPHQNYLFVSDDAAGPPAEAAALMKGLPSREKTGVIDDAADNYFTRLAIERALPAAKQAAEQGYPALVVLWQHNPDLTQHFAGLGTTSALEALQADDDNLGRLRTAIDGAGVTDRSDLMVVSDHGFATVRLRIVLADLLVNAGLKKSADSNDVVVAANGGADLIYLSRKDFPDENARRDILQKIVNFAEAQEWCGPIFARDAAPIETLPEPRGHRRHPAQKPYLGAVEGTFAESVVGIYNSDRAPDLVVSMRESQDEDNRHLTGPENPGFVINKTGQASTPNNSQPLARPIKGVVYADVGPGGHFTTGMGMHGAAGAREIHNFCAVLGPDFRRGFVDLYSTSNADVTPTITQAMGLAPNIGLGGVAPTGRAMTEALAGGKRFPGSARTQNMTATLTLQGVEAITTLKTSTVGDHLYLDDASVVHRPLGSSP